LFGKLKADKKFSTVIIFVQFKALRWKDIAKKMKISRTIIIVK
jgi:hypothetical protein